MALAVATHLMVQAQNRRNITEEELAQAHAAERETRVLGPRRKRRRVVAVPEEAPVEAPAEQALAERAPSEVAVAEQSRAEWEPEPEEADWN